MWFIGKPVINIKEYFNRINHLLKSEKYFMDDKFIEEIDYNIKRIEKFLDYELDNEVIPKEVREGIKQILPYFNLFQKNLKKINKDLIIQRFDELIKNYSSIFKVHLSYLLRHPEPDKQSYTNHSLRHLSKSGVGQAKEFSERLSELILLSPEPIDLLIYTSKNKRAHLFSDILIRRMKKNKINLNEEINLNFAEEEILTNTFVTHSLKKYLENKYDQYDKNTLVENFRDYLIDWLKNSKERALICNEITNFVNTTVKRNHTNRLNITLMFTHLPNIACYFNKMGFDIEKALNFEPADYIIYLNSRLVKI